MPGLSKVKFKLGTFEYKEPVMIYRFTKDGVVDEAEMLEMVKNRKKLVGDKPVVVMSILTGMPDFSDGARKVAALPDTTRNVIAHATVIKWLGQRLLADVFKQVNKPAYPVKAFEDEDTALKWLMEQWQKRNENK